MKSGSGAALLGRAVGELVGDDSASRRWPTHTFVASRARASIGRPGCPRRWRHCRPPAQDVHRTWCGAELPTNFWFSSRRTPAAARPSACLSCSWPSPA